MRFLDFARNDEKVKLEMTEKILIIEKKFVFLQELIFEY